MIGTRDEKVGTRDAGRGTPITPLASERLLRVLSLEVGFAYNLPQFSTFAYHVLRPSFRGF